MRVKYPSLSASMKLETNNKSVTNAFDVNFHIPSNCSTTAKGGLPRQISASSGLVALVTAGLVGVFLQKL